MVFTLHSIFTHRTAPLWQVLGQTMVNPTSYALEAISGGEPRAAAELVYYMLVDERAEAETAAAAAAAVRPSLSALTPVRAPIQLPDIKIDVISAKPRLVGTVLAAFNALDDLGDLTLTVLNAQESEPNLEMLLEDVIKSEKARTPLLPLRRGQLVNGEFRLDKDRTKLAVKNLMNALARGYHARQAATLVYDWGDVDRQLSPCGDIPTRKQVVDRKSHRSGRKQPIEAETTPPERWHTMKALLFSLVHITPSEAVRCEAATPYRVKRGHTPFPIFKLPTPLTDSPPSPTSTGCWGCRAAHSSTSWHATSQELRRCRP